MTEIKDGDYAIVIDPDAGGSVRSLRWRDRDLLRPQAGPGVLESACFPLVPFANRIAGSRFEFAGRTILLAPNHPDAPDEPVIHGFGWTSRWLVEAAAAGSIRLSFTHAAGAWPWRFRAEQKFTLDHRGVTMHLGLTNLASEPMPAGLGFHPYFERDDATIYRGLHRAELIGGDSLVETAQAVDWWHAQPVATRIVDTAYAGRSGPLEIVWGSRGLGVTIAPSPGLDCTQIYVPRDERFFCVEPVSHLPNAVHAVGRGFSMRALLPGETWTESMHLQAHLLPIP